MVHAHVVFDRLTHNNKPRVEVNETHIRSMSKEDTPDDVNMEAEEVDTDMVGNDSSDSEEEEDDSDNEGEEEEDQDAKAYVPGDKIEDGEELVMDEGAYLVYHQANLGQACLSFDVIPDDLGKMNINVHQLFSTFGITLQETIDLIILSLCMAWLAPKLPRSTTMVSSSSRCSTCIK